MARTIHRLYDDKAQKILATEAIPVAHWYYLRVLAERGKLNQLELSRRVGIASTTAVPALDNMESRGLLARTRDPHDRRKYFIALTDKGRELVDRLLPEISEMIGASLEGIPADKMRVLWDVMHRIERNLAKTSSGNGLLD